MTEPGLTDSLRLSGSESEVAATVVGACVVLCRMINEGSSTFLLLRVSDRCDNTIQLTYERGLLRQIRNVMATSLPSAW